MNIILFQVVTVYGSEIWRRDIPTGREMQVKDSKKPAVVHDLGLLLYGNDGLTVSMLMNDESFETNGLSEHSYDYRST